MITFKSKTAIVTGASSGIGLSISKELLARGAKVWLTDVDKNRLKDLSVKLGAHAKTAVIDVRNAQDIEALVEQIIAEYGSLDFMFNNAGIGIGGEMHDLSVAHFDRIIDVNIRGVMNGVAAVYPLMVKQGHGCIVNTASIGGLLPVPLMVPYGMTKHAIVGLSRGLRIEARKYGVQVNVLCPAAIETPLLDSKTPSDLSDHLKYDLRNYVRKFGKPYPVDKFSKKVLDKIKANREMIVAPMPGWLVYQLFRLAPKLVKKIIQDHYLKEMKKQH